MTTDKPNSGNGPDDIIQALGGCGRFQIRMALLVHLMKIITCWNLMSMIFVTKTPESWWCKDYEGSNVNESLTRQENITTEKSCKNVNDTKCSNFHFDTDASTIVTEWNLVCDQDWIPYTISSIQLFSQMVGNVFAGHLADGIGRKKPYFISIALMVVFNVVSYFSVNWIMFTVARVFIGIGAGFFLTTEYSYLCEFTLARWRPWLIGFPSWSLETCLLALVLWLLKDWHNVQLVIVGLGVPFLAAWWLMPESFRWYYAHDKIKDAEGVIIIMSKVNRQSVPDTSNFKEQALGDRAQQQKNQTYTLLDLFKTRTMIRITTLLAPCWIALGLASYGISFGIQKLAGNFYLNLFLFQVINIPAEGIAIGLQNKIGRRKTSILVYLLTGTAALMVGIVQYIDTDRRDALTNGFAMVASLGIAVAWGPVQTISVEAYPTVVRNTGVGFCSTLGRIGAAVGPQLVFLDDHIKGIMYFLCAAVSLISVLGLFWLPETKDANLGDKMIYPNNVDKKSPTSLS